LTQAEPVPVNKFSAGDTVYLYYMISGTMQENPGSDTLLPQLSLIDPSGEEVNTFQNRNIYNSSNVFYGNSVFTESGYLVVLEVTSATTEGNWTLNAYNSNTLIFTEGFVVEKEASPSPTVPEFPAHFIEITLVASMILVLSAVIIAKKRITSLSEDS
jgi:lipid-A-disaccharide synthase-like uncharacterized protein